MAKNEKNGFLPRFLVLFKFFIGWPVSILALIFIIKIVLPKATLVLPKFSQLNVPVLLLGIVSFSFYFVFRAQVFRKILEQKGHTFSYKQTCFLWEMSELKRYVPGNIWSFLGRSVLFGRAGVDRKTIVSALLIEAELVVLSGLIFSLFPLPILTEGFFHVLFTPAVTVFVSVLAIGICLFFIFNRYVHKKIKSKSPLMSNIFLDSSPLDTAIIFSFSLLSMLFFGLGTYFSIASIFYLDAQFLLTFVGFFVFALVVGYLSFITPMGLGVREGVMTIGLSKVMSPSSAGVASVFSRIIFIISELAFAAIVIAWHYTKNKFITKVEAWVGKHKHVLLVLCFVLLYWAYFTTASFLRFDNFFTGRFDLGNMDQAVWNTMRGRIFQITDPNGTNIISRLAFHADFFLVLLAPLYKLWANPKLLLLIQTLVLGSGGFFVYGIAKNTLKNKTLGVVFALLFLFNPAVQYTNLYDFHPVVLATTFILATWYFLQKKRYLWFLLFLILAGLTKEDVWVVGGLLGIYTAIWQRKRVFGVLIALFSFGVFFYLIEYAIPHIRGGQHFALSYYSDFGGSPIGVIKNIFLEPQKTIGTILGKEQLIYLVE
ncbi:MAG TPA: DUF2079 domain-containing protein, partial [Candidatus Saccharimonadales bacterium]|nr:DUF2079 domain-containing protein [Candidatus Saccharimonadales bacterium]